MAESFDVEEALEDVEELGEDEEVLDEDPLSEVVLDLVPDSAGDLSPDSLLRAFFRASDG